MTEPADGERGRLFGLAYRMLGSAADAEDAVQEAYARLAATEGVEDPAGWLTRVVANVSIDRLRSAQRRREAYVGPWLPEPLVTAEQDPADLAGTADSLTLAFLVVLERLTPVQRAVFLLHDVFGHPHDDIARMLGSTPAAVRQQASRARSRLAEHGAPRASDADDARTGWAVTEAFLAACEGGDLQRVMDLLAPEVVLTSDGGGVVSAARRPVVGPDHVARFLLGLVRLGREHGWQSHLTEVNTAPALVAGRGGRVETVMALEVRDGRIAAIEVVRNPDKLEAVRRRLEDAVAEDA